jgi:methylenetetrahydrofolate reductase (NADPH)
MKISALLSDPGRKIFSFELFPPKTDAGRLALERTIRDLADLSPAFVSVTYGAGGSTRAKTLDLVQWIEREARLCAMAHLTCVGATESEIAGVLDKLVEAGIENVMGPSAASALPPIWSPSSVSATGQSSASAAPATPKGTSSAATSIRTSAI